MVIYMYIVKLLVNWFVRRVLLGSLYKENLIIYDIRGIQKYIYRSNKLKEISGASWIVENLLKNSINKYCKENEIEIREWCNENEPFSFDFFNPKYVNSMYIEYVYEGGGNLLLATRLTDKKLLEFNKYIQLTFLRETYSLSVAYAVQEINKDKDYINDAYPKIKQKLNEVKKRMPQLSLAKPLPICEIDLNTGYALSEYRNDQPGENNHFSLESNMKLNKYIKSENKELDKLFEDDEIKDNGAKTLIAVVHIDGNDMGGIIASYMADKKKEHMSFADGVKISRDLSFKINKVFKENVREIIYNYPARIVINSGDDITFICKSEDSLNITKKIMEMIEENYLGDNQNNIFTSCAGIAYTHRHFPFHKAYEIAEECCVLAKNKAKKEGNKYSLSIDGKNIKRPTSYIDFEIIKAGITKEISLKREEYKHLYLRPYLVRCNHSNIELKNKDTDIDCLISTINKFNKEDVSRNAVKEIRDTYETSKTESEILFLRLKSRNNLGKEFDYTPYNESMIAKYYDASTLIDIIKEGENTNER